MTEPPEPGAAKATPSTGGYPSLRTFPSRVAHRWRTLSWETRVLAVSWVVFLGVTIFLSYQRYLTYQTNAWDLGINMQALWTTAFQGRFLYYTAELSWNSSGSLMGVNVPILLFAVAPIYRVLPGAFTLFVLQSAAVCASSLPLYLLALRRTTRPAALALALAYLFSAPILGGLFYDFHSEAFVPLFGLSVWYAWEARKPWLLGLSAAAFVCVIEFTPIILAAIAAMFLIEGLWSWKIQRSTLDREYLRWMVQLPAVMVGVSAVIAAIWLSIPKVVSPGTPKPVGQGPLGGTLSQMVLHLFNPYLLGQALSIDSHAKIIYLEALLLAGLIVWVLRPRQVLPALPWIAVVLLSALPGYDVPAGNQYTFLSFPFLLPATASGYAFLSRMIQPNRNSGPSSRDTQATRRRLWRGTGSSASPATLRSYGRVALLCGLMLAFGYSQVVWSPLSPVSGNWEKVYLSPTAHTRVLDEVAALIPAGVSISAEPDLFPQFADRADAYPYVVPGVDYIFFDTTSYWFTTNLPAPATNPPWNEEVDNISGDYGLLAYSDGVTLLQAGYTGSPRVFSPISLDLDPSSFILQNAILERDPAAPLGAYIDPNSVENSLLWFGPYTPVPPGAYSLGVWLRGTERIGGPLELRATVDLGRLVLVEGSFSPHEVGGNWTQEFWNLTIPFPTALEVSGYSGSPADGVEFGGAHLTELDVPVRVT